MSESGNIGLMSAKLFTMKELVSINSEEYRRV